ncbi:biotin transporter BioY [Streptococcus hongkongensis]
MKDTRTLTQIALMTTLIIVLGFIPPIPLGFIPVPIVLQNLGIMMAALLLGWKKGTLSILLFLTISIFVPAFTGGNTLLPVLSGPTTGYVIAWLFVPSLYSLLTANKASKNPIWIFLAIFLTGVLWVDVLGSIGLAFRIGMPLKTALLSNLAFVPGDTIKAILACLVASRVKLESRSPKKSLA